MAHDWIKKKKRKEVRGPVNATNAIESVGRGEWVPMSVFV